MAPKQTFGMTNSCGSSNNTSEAVRCKINHATKNKPHQVLYFVYICVDCNGKVQVLSVYLLIKCVKIACMYGRMCLKMCVVVFAV